MPDAEVLRVELVMMEKYLTEKMSELGNQVKVPAVQVRNWIQEVLEEKT